MTRPCDDYKPDGDGGCHNCVYSHREPSPVPPLDASPYPPQRASVKRPGCVCDGHEHVDDSWFHDYCTVCPCRCDQTAPRRNDPSAPSLPDPPAQESSP